MYCIIFVGDVTELMFTMTSTTVKRSTACWPMPPLYITFILLEKVMILPMRMFLSKVIQYFFLSFSIEKCQ